MMTAPLVTKPAAGHRPAEQLGHRRANIDIDGRVVAGERIGKVRERLAVVVDGLAAERKRKDALGLIAVGLLAEGIEDGALVDGGAHRQRVLLAGVEYDVVDEDGADTLRLSGLGAEEVVVERGVALDGVRMSGET
jgi:hypothetical protein